MRAIPIALALWLLALAAAHADGYSWRGWGTLEGATQGVTVTLGDGPGHTLSWPDQNTIPCIGRLDAYHYPAGLGLSEPAAARYVPIALPPQVTTSEAVRYVRIAPSGTAILHLDGQPETDLFELARQVKDQERRIDELTARLGELERAPSVYVKPGETLTLEGDYGKFRIKSILMRDHNGVEIH